MRRIPLHRLAATALVLGLGLCQPARALHILDKLGPNPTLAGTPMSCGGVNAYVAEMDDVAMAERGRLLLSPAFFTLPAAIQWFVYTHECAHQRVGGNEGAADCLAVQRGRDSGLFTPEVLQEICDYVTPLPEDRTHLAGPLRCAHIRSCFEAH